MKKVLLSILTFVLAFTLCACESNSTNENNDSNNQTENNVTKKFEDLTKTRRIGTFDDVWVDLPNWREDGSENSKVIESKNYFIVAVISEENYTFEELFNNKVKSTLKHFVDRGTYEDFQPNTKEEVTLSNGIKATKFEGNLSMDNYGTIHEYPTYGYYFNYNNYPIMIMSVETTISGVDNNSEEQRLNTNKYVDEIVQTIRDSE